MCALIKKDEKLRNIIRNNFHLVNEIKHLNAQYNREYYNRLRIQGQNIPYERESLENKNLILTHVMASPSGDRKKSMWGFVPSYISYIVDAVDVINLSDLTYDSKIVDAGCGISQLLMLLSIYGFKHLYGIEYQERLVNIFSTMFERSCGNKEHKVYHGDLLARTGKHIELYREANMVYSYMPIESDEGYAKYMRKVCNNVPLGCIVMDFYGPIYEVMNCDSRFKMMDDTFGGTVWIKTRKTKKRKVYITCSK